MSLMHVASTSMYNLYKSEMIKVWYVLGNSKMWEIMPLPLVTSNKGLYLFQMRV